MYKITSLEDGKRKILRQKFWSHGTPLGYLGPVSLEALGLGACRLLILVIWDPYEPPVPVALHVHAKNLKTIGSWCAKCRPIVVVAQNVVVDECTFTLILITWSRLAM